MDHRRVNNARANGGYAEPAAAIFGAQGHCETDQTKFRSLIRSHFSGWDEPDDTADIDDMRLPLCDHHGQKLSNQINRRQQIYGQDRLPLIGGHVLGVTVEAEPGAVDEDVQAVARCAIGANKRSNLFRLRKIAYGNMELTPRLSISRRAASR